MEKLSQYILGLDLGANSLGWFAWSRATGKIISVGVRCFDAGVDGGFSNIEKGKDESRAVDRRNARQLRRQIWRRRKRQIKTYGLLMRNGLLPDCEYHQPLERDKALKKLDAELLQKFPGTDHVLPYLLRALALDRRLELFELGRALYHLAQRRGFKSGRKDRAAEQKLNEEGGKESRKKSKTAAKKGEEDVKKDEDVRQVKIAIEYLRTELNGRTLGQYFASLNPEKKGSRIRGPQRWTARDMYENEFERIWVKQAEHHELLQDDAFKNAIWKALFYQRPLKSQKSLIGSCECVPGAQRAPWAFWEAQRFRLLQKVNDLTIKDAREIKRALTEFERTAIINKLENEGDQTFAALRELIGIKRGKFSHEEGGEKKLPGNRTTAKLQDLFEVEVWKKYRDQIVSEWRSIQKEAALEKRAATVKNWKEWKLGPEQAHKFAYEVTLEDEYCGLSRKALQKLLPEMENGVPYQTAKKKCFPEAFEPKECHELLPPVKEMLPDLRNPAVMRALTEMRKVVNALIRKFGKPDRITVELARELKNPRKKREKIWERNCENRDANDQAEKIAAYLLDCDEDAIRPRDTEKLRLAEECGIQHGDKRTSLREISEKLELAAECTFLCPYTQKQFSMKQLLSADVEVEHIIPFSRCLDDSFLNKTLCFTAENRERKRKKTPYEAYSDTPKWDDILASVRRFKGTAKLEKLRRFQLHGKELEDFLKEFAERQLVDTKYASKLARKYLGTLYGGLSDADGNLRIYASSGQITKFVRDELQLSQFLGGREKNRDDHRHHAVDAIAISLASSDLRSRLSQAAEAAMKHEDRRRFVKGCLQAPWPEFLRDAEAAINALIVSHRPTRTLSGPLHQQTNYSKRRDEKGKAKPDGEFTHIRKRLDAIASAGVLEGIVDEQAKKIVIDRYRALASYPHPLPLKQSKKKPSEVFKDPASHPCFASGTPIHSARIRLVEKTVSVGRGASERHVQSGNNHHMEVVEITDDRGRKKWVGYVVTLLEALRRKQSDESVVKTDHGKGTRFLFSIASGDTVKMNVPERGLGLYHVGTVYYADNGTGKLNCVSINEARTEGAIKAEDKKRRAAGNKDTLPQFFQLTVTTLQEWSCARVLVSPLGEVTEFHA